jgi:hypothetical protein
MARNRKLSKLKPARKGVRKRERRKGGLYVGGFG